MEESECEHTLEGWGNTPLKQLEAIKQKVSVLEEKVVEKREIPILKGDKGEVATYTKILIRFRGSLW